MNLAITLSRLFFLRHRTAHFAVFKPLPRGVENRVFEFQRLTGLLQRTIRPSARADSAVPASLELLAKWFSCQWAAYWRIDSSAQCMRARATWSENLTLLEPFHRDTEARMLTLGEGVPGQVWRSGRWVSTNDLVRDMRLPRSLLAKAGGLCSGVWFPLRANQETRAVIELLANHPLPDDLQFLDQLAVLEKPITETLLPRGGLDDYRGKTDKHVRKARQNGQNFGMK